MDPSHFRGPQPPTSHVVPGAPGAAGHPPHIGFIEPPFIIPAAFLTEIIMTIRNEFVSQNRLITNQFSSMRQEYGEMEREMNRNFELCVRQTDRILAEQHTRFELWLKDIQNGMRQFHESQTAAITDLGGRLNSLGGLTGVSREVLTSEIAAVVETMGHGFDGLVAMIKTNDYAARDRIPLEGGIPAYSASLEAFLNPPKLVPAAWPQTDSEADISTTHSVTDHPSLESGGPQNEQAAELPPVIVLSDPGSPPTSSGDNPETEEQDQLYEGDTPAVSTPATEEPLVPPTIDTNDVTTIPASPLTIPPEDIPTTPPADCDSPQNPPPQDSLFDTTSPLTSMSSPRSQNLDDSQAPILSPEIAICTPHPAPSNTTSRKRKRSPCGRGALKSSRKNGKSQPRGKREERVGASEGDHEDLSIWPPAIEDDSNGQMYVGCDRCARWFHFGCVGLQGDHEDGSPWECPPCVRDPTRDANVPREGGEMCSRPGCTVSKGGEYFMSQLLGRCYAPDRGVVKYLVAYEGYDLDQCTWEPPESFSNDSSKIEEFLEWWATENPGVSAESLDPHETIFLHDAYVLARAGITWPGA